MIKLYTLPICPKCSLIKTKLSNKGIPFEEIQDEALMEEKGFMYLPVLEKDNGEIISSFSEINKFVNG